MLEKVWASAKYEFAEAHVRLRRDVLRRHELSPNPAIVTCGCLGFDPVADVGSCPCPALFGVTRRAA